jgi:hypothetical protein
MQGEPRGDGPPSYRLRARHLRTGPSQARERVSNLVHTFASFHLRCYIFPVFILLSTLLLYRLRWQEPVFRPRARP